MLTLYTAVGKLQIRKNSAGKEYPLVMVGEKERTLTPYEMLLWSSLSWNILTFDETRALFYEREQEMHILSALDFEYYLKRLIFRGLVVSGTGYSGISALHQLLAPLYVHSCADRLLEKLAALADMVCLQHYPLRTAVRIFRKEKLTVEEKLLIGRCGPKRIAASEILEYGEAPDQHRMAAVLAGVYLKRQVIFETF